MITCSSPLLSPINMANKPHIVVSTETKERTSRQN